MAASTLEPREGRSGAADAAANERLRRDVVEGPPPDAYTLLAEAVAKTRRLVIDDAEVGRMADTVGVETNAEREEEA